LFFEAEKGPRETSLENTGLCYSGPISCYHVWYGEEKEEGEEQETLDV